MFKRSLSRVLYPIAEWKMGRKIGNKLEKLQMYANLPFVKRRSLAFSYLLQVLFEAEQHVPYYRDLFASKGFTSKDIRHDPNLFFELPLLTKEIIQEQGLRLVNEKYMNTALELRRTNGSTGLVTSIFYNNEALDWSAAQNILMLRWAGKNLHEREVLISSVRGEVSSASINFEKKKCLVLNRVNIFVGVHTEQELAQAWEKIVAAKAVSVQGHPSTMYALACFVDNIGGITRPVFDVFVSTGEFLPSRKRLFIEKVLLCRVADRYGAAEFGVMAQELAHGPKSKLLVHDAMVWPEMINVDQYGSGELVFSGLRNIAMPLIRYCTGDKGHIEEKEDGWWINDLQGRVHDMVNINGVLYPTHYIMNILTCNCDGVLDFQIAVQGDEAKELWILVKPKQENEVLSQIQEVFPYLPVRFVKPEDFVYSGRLGKFRYIVKDFV